MYIVNINTHVKGLSRIHKYRVLVTYALVVSIVATGAVTALLTTQKTISGSGSIKGVGIVHSDSFETGDLSNFNFGPIITPNYGNLNVTNELSYSGAYSLKASVLPRYENVPLGWFSNAKVGYTAPSLQSTLRATGMFYVDEFMPDTTHPTWYRLEELFSFLFQPAAGTYLFSVGLYQDLYRPCQLAMYYLANGSHQPAVWSGVQIAPRTWFKLSAQLTVGAGTGEVRVFLNDAAIPSLTITGIDNTASFGSPVNGISTICLPAGNTVGVTATVYVDDVAIEVPPFPEQHTLTVQSSPEINVPVSLNYVNIGNTPLRSVDNTVYKVYSTLPKQRPRNSTPVFRQPPTTPATVG